jgi:hypothetical protein
MSSGFIIGVLTLATVLLVLVSALLLESERNLDAEPPTK